MDEALRAVLMAAIVAIVGGIMVGLYVFDILRMRRIITALKRRVNDLERSNLRLSEIDRQLQAANSQLEFIVRSIMEHTQSPKGDNENG